MSTPKWLSVARPRARAEATWSSAGAAAAAAARPIARAMSSAVNSKLAAASSAKSKDHPQDSLCLQGRLEDGCRPVEAQRVPQHCRDRGRLGALGRPQDVDDRTGEQQPHIERNETLAEAPPDTVLGEHDVAQVLDRKQTAVDVDHRAWLFDEPQLAHVEHIAAATARKCPEDRAHGLQDDADREEDHQTDGLALACEHGRARKAEHGNQDDRLGPERCRSADVPQTQRRLDDLQLTDPPRPLDGRHRTGSYTHRSPKRAVGIENAGCGR